MKKHSPDITGQRFGRLVALRRVGVDKHRNILWEFKCDCGNIHTTQATYVRTGDTTSCGCWKSEAAAKRCHERLFEHGLTRTPIGASWQAMMQRCFNPKRKNWMNYGGRGILPCQFLEASPANLLLLLGDRPSKEMSLDRIDNALGYFCGQCRECIANNRKLNVRWATSKEQNCNRRDNVRLLWEGEQLMMREWMQRTGRSRKQFEKEVRDQSFTNEKLKAD